MARITQNLSPRVRIASAVVGAALVLGLGVHTILGYGSGISFLSRYQVSRQPATEATEETSSAEVFWVHAPIAEITARIANVPMYGAGNTMSSGTPPNIDSYGRYSYDTGEGWYAVPGQASFPRWPDPTQVVEPGTTKEWTTLRYVPPSHLPFMDLIRRIFN